MAELDSSSSLSIMNGQLETYLKSVGKGGSFMPFSKVDNDTLAEYCNARFGSGTDLDIHN